MLKVNTCDVIRLSRLSETMREDAQRQLKSGATMSPRAVLSICEIIDQCIGAPIDMPTREMGVAEADKRYKGSPSQRLAFNDGVRWALMAAESRRR